MHYGDNIYEIIAENIKERERDFVFHSLYWQKRQMFP